MAARMSVYNLLKQILFSMDPEYAHHWALRGINLAYKTWTSGLLGGRSVEMPRTIMGLHFKNPIGLAAGFDKSAEYVDALAALGFGFIEVGTLTPRPQKGNPTPRLFRLPEQQAIINRMGFNNKGMEYAARRLEKIKYRGILGINLGKNADTPLDKAVDDYLSGMRTLSPFASYFTINISSPNTSGLRDLLQKDLLRSLLRPLKEEQAKIFLRDKKYIPLVVKVSPDMTDEQIAEASDVFIDERIDGVIATNTTVSRDGVLYSPLAAEAGGMSGMPLCPRSTHVIHLLSKSLQNKIPIIGSGGVMDEESGKDKINAGAQLLQVYTGFIYYGPEIISRLAKII
jgi:dihydroorotate dehydrogenase